MKAAGVVLIVIAVFALINFVREGRDFHVVHVLPFAGGHHPGIYDLSAVILLGLALYGWTRLNRRGRKD